MNVVQLIFSIAVFVGVLIWFIQGIKNIIKQKTENGNVHNLDVIRVITLGIISITMLLCVAAAALFIVDKNYVSEMLENVTSIILSISIFILLLIQIIDGAIK